MKRRLVSLLSLVAAAGLIGLGVVVAMPRPSDATTNASCPNVEVGTGCAYVVTVDANGSASIAPGPNPAAFDGDEDVMVGVVNNSTGVVPSITLSGSRDTFGFDGDGLCAYASSPAGCPFGSTGYEGPGTSFAGLSADQHTGTVVFSPALAVGGSAYFSLEDAPSTATAVVLSPATVAPQTTGQAFTAPVATIADGNPSDNAASFTATVNWGDGTPLDTTTPVVTSTAGGFAVSGTHTYAVHGTFAPIVTVTGPGGATGAVTDSVSVSDLVVPCTGTSCTGTLSTNTLSLQASTKPTGAGDLLFSTDPNAGATALNCGDPFRHAPRVITESDSFATGTSSITSTETFLAKDGTKGGAGPVGLLFWVCFQSSHPFKNANGQMTTLGMLPLCNPLKADPGPCVNWVLPAPGGKIVERVTYPVGDPRMG